MPIITRVERLLGEHGIGVVAVFPDGHVGQPRSRLIRSARKVEPSTEHLIRVWSAGGETKRLIADRIEETVDANLGIDREGGARHRGEDKPQLRDCALAWIDERVGGGAPRTS